MRRGQGLLLVAGVTWTLGVGTPALYANAGAPFYNPQTVYFTGPTVDFVFIKNTDGMNSWAGEDYGVVRIVGINDNADSQGLGVPSNGFHGNQGAVLVYDVTDESENGDLCALSTAFPTNAGGPGASGLPTNLTNTILKVDIAFDIPGNSSVVTLYSALGLWMVEEDGDKFQTWGILDLTKEWQTYAYHLNELANHLHHADGDGIFGDSLVTLLSLSFQDPAFPIGLGNIIYFVDNFRIETFGETAFLEDFEAIPEPASLFLVGIGMGLARWVRRRRTI